MLESRNEPRPDLLDLPGFDDGAETEVRVEAIPGTPFGSWWRRRWIVVVVAVLVVALTVGGIGVAARLRTGKVTYQYGKVARGNLALTVGATGPVQTAVYNVNFSGTGKIASVDVAVGQQVAAGQKLATLDTTSLRDAVNQAQVAVSTAQTGLDNAQTNQSKVNTQTQAQLNAAYDQEQNAIYACQHPPAQQPTPAPDCQQLAQDQYASAQAQANVQNAQAQAQVNAAQAQLSTAQAQLQTAQHNLDNATLTAPHAGTIAAINGTVGGTPGSGSAASGGNVFISIVDLSALQVQTNVNEADIGGIAVGNAAQFTVSAYTNHVFRGTVRTISPLGQTVSNVVTYPVTIDVDMQSLANASLLPGMTATVTITTAQRFNVLLVPAAAVTFARTAANSSASGFVTRTQLRDAFQQARQLLTQVQNGSADVSADNPTPAFVVERVNAKWIVKPVVLGLTDGNAYEVLAGLADGESVVTSMQNGSGSAANGTSTSGNGTGGGGRFFGSGGASGR